MRRIFIFFVATVFLAAYASCAHAAPTIHTTVSKKTVTIGERIRYAVEISNVGHLEVEFPKYADGMIGFFEIKECGRILRDRWWGKKDLVQWYDITAYDPGKYTIPVMEVKYRVQGKGGSEWNFVKSEEIPVTIESVLPSGQRLTDVKDVKGPYAFYEFNWVPVIFTVTAIVVIILVINLILKVRSRASVKTPYEQALYDLGCARDALARTGAVNDYYSGVSNCVRNYIERALTLRAPEMTTEEFLVSIDRSSALTDGQKALLRSFLGACDLVKFARYAPPEEEIENVSASARHFIDESDALIRARAEDARKKR